MKTILTEWGPMSLNDWREIKLMDADWNARFGRTFYRVWMANAAFWGIVGIAISAFAINHIANGDLAATVLLVASAFTCHAVRKSILTAHSVREFYLLKRQVLVDEVAAKMRTFK